MSEIYQSSTHGNIPLSFTGRRLLANLREAINRAIDHNDFNTDNSAVSKSRGDIAQYMSKLEGRLDKAGMVKRFECGGEDFTQGQQAVPPAQPGPYMLESIQDEPPKPADIRSPEKQAADEFLEAAREFNAARAKLARCAEQAQHLGLKPTWINETLPGPYNKPKQFDKPHYFQPLTFEVSRIVKTPRVVEDEHVEVMGREP